ncbi:hypothetical protein ES288_D13G061400v1 [Gossypium darwinii]|uniref:Uncharacterized protein n=1 Tax=Gossypium darwinii TaxID=34276 RepID=A0A5D1ZUY8_GOSDA|nr:hypothetical protein ES288_D13G061400v1 [Gossypium darwinii]
MYKRLENLEVISYSDSDFFGYVDSRKSTSGYIFMFASGVISQRSVKQILTATSTMEAEFVSCFGLPHMEYVDPLTKGMPLQKFNDHVVTMRLAPTL